MATFRLTQRAHFLVRRAGAAVLIAGVIVLLAACGNEERPTLFGRLIFLSRPTGDYDIRLRTSNDRVPIELGRALPWDSQPVWSPDGSRIAFYSDRNFNLPDRDNNVDIYTMGSNGEGLTQLTDHNASDAFPDWSPDGARIAFYSERDGNGELYAMNADGSGVTRMTNDPSVDIPYGWSPDGQSLLFSSGRNGTLDLFLLNVEDLGVKQLTNLKGHEATAEWSPDGTRIAFDSTTAGNSEVFVVNADGSRESQPGR